jgi:hypothetical protein
MQIMEKETKSQPKVTLRIPLQPERHYRLDLQSPIFGSIHYKRNTKKSSNNKDTLSAYRW